MEREAKRLAPKTELELRRMEETQSWALQNLSCYLTADYMDVYVATSMRSDADFISVNDFVKRLFTHPKLRQMKLRYFNPTQSWIDDRIGKGLVEALMLKRSSLTIYMAQKADTFGKDSEASVALGQGKPVVVYVPKLESSDAEIDSERLSAMERSELLAKLSDLKEDITEIDDSMDNEALVGRVLSLELNNIADEVLINIILKQWADFDLYGEAERIEDPQLKENYRVCLDECIKGGSTPSLAAIRKDLIGILVATANRFERRATMFKEVHPLALQVILSTGVLNGILVVRSVDQSAELIFDLLHNDLALQLNSDSINYKLIEVKTKSTIRVISKHQLIQYAFENYYRQQFYSK